MSEIYILVYAETTLLIVGSSIAAIFPLFWKMSTRLPGSSSQCDTGSKNGTPLRTFGQGTYKKRRLVLDDDETTLTRIDSRGNALNGSLEGIIKTTDVQQTWGLADASYLSTSQSRQLGLAHGIV